MKRSAWRPFRERLWARMRHAAHVAREMLFGITVYDWVHTLQHQRGEVEHLFILISFGDILGLPILPPYYTMRLLPYVVPLLDRWKRSLLRERDLTDLSELIEGSI